MRRRFDEIMMLLLRHVCAGTVGNGFSDSFTDIPQGCSTDTRGICIIAPKITLENMDGTNQHQTIAEQDQRKPRA